MRLSCTVFEILSLIFQKITRSRDSDHAPFGDNYFVVHRLGLAMFNPHTKFEVSMITCNEEMKGNAKVKILVLSHPLERGNAQG